MTKEIVTLVALFAIVAVACGGTGGPKSSVTPTEASNVATAGSATSTLTPKTKPLATPTQVPTEISGGLYPADFRTGTVIDGVLEAMAARDAETIASLIELTPIPCAEFPSRANLRPPCENDEVEGDLVPVLVAARCELFFFRKAEIGPDLYVDLVNKPRRLFSASMGSMPFWPSALPAEYVLQFAVDLEDGHAPLFWLNSAGRIVYLQFGCVAPMYDPPPGTEYIAPPLAAPPS